jgi:hypothetical protein
MVGEGDLRQVVTLEQYYEDDEIILAICANKARLFPRFGISKITDDLLMNEVHVAVNVGMGASNPTERLQKFLAVTNAAIELANTAPPGFNVPEALKELYSHAGYRDGTRFFGQQDPRLLKAMGLVQQVTAALKDKKLELAASNQIDQAKIASSDRQKSAQLQVDAKRIQGDLDIRAAEVAIERQRLELREAATQARGASVGYRDSLQKRGSWEFGGRGSP